MEELEAGVEQALTFSREAAALELFPIWKIPECVEDSAMLEPWTITLTIHTAYSGAGTLQQQWEVRTFEREVQAVPVRVHDRKTLIPRHG